MHKTITEDSIRALVDEFYGDVRADEKLGPVFDKAIGTADEDWVQHLARISMFWSSVMLATKGYDGKPFQVHKDLPPFDARLFSGWLALFANAAIKTHDILPATVFIRKAVSIADVMMRDLYGGRFETPEMPRLPGNLEHYRTTPTFSAAGMPEALRKAHRTAPGIFGRIVVAKGRLLYTIGRKQCHVLTQEISGVIEPETFHFVTPLDEAEFVVEFYKDPSALA
jgi:hemoglobin